MKSQKIKGNWEDIKKKLKQQYDLFGQHEPGINKNKQEKQFPGEGEEE